MGICDSLKNKRQELFTGHMFIPIEITNKVSKSVCKIKIRKKGSKDCDYGTGFFMNLNNSKKYLFTNYHIISEKIINEEIEIEIHNHKKMNLKLNNRYIKYFPEPIDIAIIEIKETDEIYNDIILSDYDMNYKRGYEFYEDSDVFSLEYPYGKNVVNASGKIKHIDNYEFDHTIPTDYGSSGCPIILLNINNINMIKVIGIHKSADYEDNINQGTFVGEIFKDNDFNYYINSEGRILNQHENNNKYNNYNKEIKYENNMIENKYILLKNEITCIYNKQVKEISLLYDYRDINIWSDEYMKYTLEGKDNINGNNIEIYIDDKKIEYDYKYKSCKKGKIKVKFKFNKLLTSTFCMFRECFSLESIDLSSFNAINVKNMACMFIFCSSLKSINLSSFNTSNVIHMGYMFQDCSSLKTINLSSFNTTNTTNMCYMFSGCSSLKSMNLS